MYEIVILFIIAAVLSNIIKILGRPTRPAQTQERTAPKEIPSDVDESWASGKGVTSTVSDTEGQIQFKSQTKPQSRSQAKPQTKPQVKPLVAPRVATRLEQDQSSFKKGLIKLTPYRLVDGIIISEILSPPKCRRNKL